ncbi:hypothetical protein O181_012000 [Austropuccinia psidii MF-1]|uniref:Uncharacterized protein n=1 Tax=Austropuccinia psidii MF-1 TaxID=1389203 RepID=A0A9Q3GMG9_9BASI|nr:hypothetical protein [Austropuccinia psidii MF-1]
MQHDTNQLLRWLQDMTTPNHDELDKIKDKISKKRKKITEEQEYSLIAQNRKLYPSLQAQFARQYQLSTQNEEWKKKDENWNTDHEYLGNEKESQYQYLNQERRNEHTVQKSKFENHLENTS